MGAVLDPSATPDPARVATVTHGRGRAAVQALSYAAPLLFLVSAGWAHRWMTDDGFIYLRVVRQLRAGNGPVFNPGERVEAYTGTLWVALLYVFDLATPVRLEWVAVLLGLTASIAGVALAMAGSRRLWSFDRSSAFILPFGAVAFVAILPAWVFATSGLETGLCFAWIGATLYLLAGWARASRGTLSAPVAAVVGLGWLVRPELAVYSALFLALVLVADRERTRRGERLRVLVAAMALPAAYQIFRMGYFGSIVPNTAIAKESGSTNWSRGFDYLIDFTQPYWLWLVFAILVTGGYVPCVTRALRRGELRPVAVAAVLVASGALHATYLVAVGGDYHHARLLLPAYLAFCGPVAVVPATRPHAAALALAVWAAVAALVLRPPQFSEENWYATGFLIPTEYGRVTSDSLGWGTGGRYNSWYTGPGYYYEAELRIRRGDVELADGIRTPVGAFSGVGVAGYVPGTDFRVLDLMGLADTFTAHLETTDHWTTMPRGPGHEKPLPAPWVAARLTAPGTTPKRDLFPDRLNPLIPVTVGYEFQEQVAWARAALKCDEISDLMEAATGPMTPGRFARNLVESFHNTRLRIPPDPEEAYRRFCGRGVPDEVRALRKG